MKNLKLILIFSLFINLAFGQTKPKYYTGMNFDDAKYKATLQKAPLTRELYSTLPKSASLKKYAPTPKTQGSYGTCVGWSTCYCAMTIIDNMKSNSTDITANTDNAYSPTFVYVHVKQEGDADCKYGTYIDQALTYLKNNGDVKYSDMSLDCPTEFEDELYKKAKQHRIKDFAKLFDVDDGSNFKISSVKKSLAEKKPVVIGFNLPESFYEAKSCWTPTENSASAGGHAMCVIGYDDEKYGGAFEFQNSWGNTWGNEGYMWVKYDDFATYTKYAFEMIDQASFINTENDLSGKVKFQLASGKEMKATLSGTNYLMNDSYKSGTKFRLYLSNNEPAFVYAIGSDLSNKCGLVFPHKAGISPALTYQANDVALPDEDHYIEMDNTEGTDFLCVLYAKNTIDINGVIAAMGKATGTFEQRIKQVLATDLVSPANIKFSANGEMGFTASSKGKNVVALIVETKHIK
ncbi:MAG: cysteine protease [Bacteroidetes bacterium]|nr:cysteine protease [Bacteroidota bacterium]